MQKKFQSFNNLILLSVVVFFCQGCFHYSKGSGRKLPFDKIFVAPVKNESFAPQVQALLTKQVRTKLSNQQGLELSSSSDHAAILEISVIKFEQNISSHEENDTEIAKSFDVTMTVICSLKNIDTGEVYFDNYKIYESVECHTLQDFQQSKHQSIPQLTEKLAEKICSAVCHPW